METAQIVLVVLFFARWRGLGVLSMARLDRAIAG
jgi:hypothetical protein